ncbi:MAG: hypothetical protein KGH53_00690 [Candidatus Micrarchaeota archaeon]|nr:hypothetical protein [Candidatus Micrarchaeota archaeon]
MIDEERKKRLGLIDNVKRLRHKMAYKQAEFAALSTLNSTVKVEKTKSIGYLKRLKERLEFKIATEASSLSAEKDLIRKINEVDAELDGAIKTYKARKKVDLIKGDIEDATKQIEEHEKLIFESNKALDELYTKLRALTGFRGERSGNGGGDRRNGERRQGKPQKQQEISLADIAINTTDKKNNNDVGYGDDITN